MDVIRICRSPSVRYEGSRDKSMRGAYLIREQGLGTLPPEPFVQGYFGSGQVCQAHLTFEDLPSSCYSRMFTVAGHTASFAELEHSR